MAIAGEHHPEYVSEVGRLCAAWSFFEVVTDRLLWGILGVDERIGSLIGSPKDMAGRWSLILNNAEAVLTKDEMALLRKVNKSLVAVTHDRNVVVHGQIISDNRDRRTYACITRGADAGKRHPITAEAVRTIIRNIGILAKATKNLVERHRWLGEIPEMETVRDWPKPLEVFP